MITLTPSYITASRYDVQEARQARQRQATKQTEKRLVSHFEQAVKAMPSFLDTTTETAEAYLESIYTAVLKDAGICPAVRTLNKTAG